jgi:hypothetical protein
MRETLHQLTLSLALPIAVGAVWIARAERAEPPAREHATAYRVELADLPLPVRERLRTPGLAAPMPVARRAPEDSAPTPERPTLENPRRPAAVEIAVESNSKRDVVAAPSPRAAEVALVALPVASQAALGTAAPVAPAAPLLSSRSGTAPAATVPAAASETAPPPVIVAATGTGKAASAAGADPNAWEQDRVTAMHAARSASPQSPQPLVARGTGAEPVAAPARAVGNSPIVTGDVGKSPPIAATPIATGDVGKPHTIASQPLEIDPGRREGSGTPGGRAPEVLPSEGRTPLLPSRPIDRVEDFSLPISDLPRFEPEPVNTVTSRDPEPKILESTPIVQLFAPRLLVLVPEPGSAILFGVSLAALGALRRSRRRV